MAIELFDDPAKWGAASAGIWDLVTALALAQVGVAHAGPLAGKGAGELLTGAISSARMLRFKIEPVLLEACTGSMHGSQRKIAISGPTHKLQQHGPHWRT